MSFFFNLTTQQENAERIITYGLMFATSAVSLLFNFSIILIYNTYRGRTELTNEFFLMGVFMQITKGV